MFTRTKCQYCPATFKSATGLEKHLRMYCKVRRAALAEAENEINHGSGPFPINPAPQVEFTDEQPRKIKLRPRDNPLTLVKKELSAPIEGRKILIRAGNHFIDPNDVAAIRPTRNNDLFIVKLHSDPAPEFPLWMKADEVVELLTHFDVRSSE